MHKLKRVMIADDDPGIVDFLSIMLEFEGYEVIRKDIIKQGIS